MKSCATSLATTVLLAGLLVACKPTTTTETKHVGVLLLASHPVIAQLRDGFTNRLSVIARAEKISIEFDEKNAEGNGAQLNQLTAYFSRGGHQLVYAVGSEAALKMKAQNASTPILFAGTPDPVRNGFVESLERPGGYLTGVRFLPPPTVLLDIFQKTHPRARRLAVLRNPSEVNSISVAEPLIAEAKKRGLEIGDFGVTELSQLNPTLDKIAKERYDGVFIPTDNLIYQNLKRVLEITKPAGIPVFSVTDVAVKMGADFSVGITYSEVGEKTADLAAEILFRGRSPQTLPVPDLKTGNVFLTEEFKDKYAAFAPTEFPVKIVK